MKENQKDRVIRYIKDFGSITTLEAMKDLGIMRLGARIYDLQKDGYVFKKEWETAKNRYDEDVSFKKYSFDEMIEDNMNHIPRID